MEESNTFDRMADALEAIRKFRHDSTKFPAIQLYVDHHLKELEDSYWQERTGKSRPQTDEVLAILVADTTWDELDDSGTVVDCILPGSVTNYLLSVRFDHDGQLRSIEMES